MRLGKHQGGHPVEMRASIICRSVPLDPKVGGRFIIRPAEEQIRTARRSERRAVLAVVGCDIALPRFGSRSRYRSFLA